MNVTKMFSKVVSFCRCYIHSINLFDLPCICLHSNQKLCECGFIGYKGVTVFMFVSPVNYSNLK